MIALHWPFIKLVGIIPTKLKDFFNGLERDLSFNKRYYTRRNKHLRFSFPKVILNELKRIKNSNNFFVNKDNKIKDKINFNLNENLIQKKSNTQVNLNKIIKNDVVKEYKNNENKDNKKFTFRDLNLNKISGTKLFVIKEEDEIKFLGNKNKRKNENICKKSNDKLQKETSIKRKGIKFY